MTNNKGFTLDFEDTLGGYESIKDGSYEVIIERAQEDAAKSGTDFTEFVMVVRNDLDQPFKNHKIWHRNWVTKATGKYNMMMFNTIGKAAQLENNKTYSNFRELLDDYEGRPVQVLVRNETSKYNGKTYENLNVKQWNPTKFPQVQHRFKGDNNSGGNSPAASVDISDDDMPF